MLIDWFTVGAQIVNFLILLALLKVFLYDRILEAMDQRQQRIRDRLAEADEKRREAEQEARSLREERQALEEKREQRMTEAKEAAEKQRREMQEEARREVAERRKFWEQQLENERRDLIRKLQKSVATEVFAVAGNVLADLADQALEEEVVEMLVRKLRELDRDQREELRQSLQEKEREAVVRSVFSIPENRREQIGAVLKDVVGESVEIRYETDPDLILGIELKTPGKKVAWHADQYLEGLEKRALAALESRLDSQEEQPSQSGRAETHDNE